VLDALAIRLQLEQVVRKSVVYELKLERPLDVLVVRRVLVEIVILAKVSVLHAQRICQKRVRVNHPFDLAEYARSKHNRRLLHWSFPTAPSFNSALLH
jgi:hypothetical protein